MTVSQGKSVVRMGIPRGHSCAPSHGCPNLTPIMVYALCLRTRRSASSDPLLNPPRSAAPVRSRRGAATRRPEQPQRMAGVRPCGRGIGRSLRCSSAR